MKKITTLLSLLFVTCFCSASDVEMLLQKAIESYNSGDVLSTIQNIDAARKLLDEETITNIKDEYLEVTTWDLIDLKSESYIGKKVKFTGEFYGVMSKDKINVKMRSCTFDNTLIDKILTLENYKKYSFYGIVKEPLYKNGSPYMHVEAIE